MPDIHALEGRGFTALTDKNDYKQFLAKRSRANVVPFLIDFNR